MKVCLVNPPFLFPRRSDAVYSHLLGLRSLSAHLRSLGHEVVIVDALMDGFRRVRREDGGLAVGLSVQTTVARVPADADLVGVSAPFSQAARVVHEILDGLSARRLRALLVVGGVYPSAQPESAVRSAAHAVVVGEGEIPLARLAAGEDPASVPGVYLHGADPVDGFRPGEAVLDLDSLPPPDRDLPGFDRYLELSPRGVRGRVASVLTSRGCPFDCEFCSIHPVYGWDFRARSAEHVLDEIRALVVGHGVRSIEFEDDNLTWDRARVVEVFEGFRRLRAAGHELTWRVPNGVRVDTLDDELIALMVRSGCAALGFGVEHGDPRMLALMRKELDLDRVEEVVRSCIRLGVPRVNIFYLIGYPGEERDNFEVGLRYLRRLRGLSDRVRVSPYLAQPYPGTRLLQRCKEEGWAIDPAFDAPLVVPGVMSTRRVIGIRGPGLDPTEVIRRREQVMRIFGPRWKAVVKRLMPDRLVTRLGRVRPSAWRAGSA